MKHIALLCLLPLAFAERSDPRAANVERFFERVKELVKKEGYVENPVTCDPTLKEKLIKTHQDILNQGWEVVEDALDNSWGYLMGATLQICEHIDKANNKAFKEHDKCVAEKNMTKPEKKYLSVPIKETVPYLRSVGEMWTMAAKFSNLSLHQALFKEMKELKNFPNVCLQQYKQDHKQKINRLYDELMVLAEQFNTSATHIENGAYNFRDEIVAAKYATAPGLSFFSGLCATWLELNEPGSYGFKGLYKKMQECEIEYDRNNENKDDNNEHKE